MVPSLKEYLEQLPPELRATIARYGVGLAINFLLELEADLGAEREPARRGRAPRSIVKPKAPRRIASGRSGWPSDPEERSREMKRRQALRKEKQKHAQRSAGARKRWQNKSKAQRQAWLNKMQDGKRRAMKAHAKTEEAAA